MRINRWMAWLVMVVALVAVHRSAQATEFTPPSDVVLNMYRLQYPSGARYYPEDRCNTGDTDFGCTYATGDPTYAYPYGNQNPVKISVDKDYLLDVVPQELGTYYDPTALEAQAIAARTYAYWHIARGTTLNNSTSFQAFIPFRFETLPPTRIPAVAGDPCSSNNLNARQVLVCDAVKPRLYVSQGMDPGGDLPALTEFSADVWLRTNAGGTANMISVDDPISSGCDANDYGHGRGMSQEGASRWARGDRCSYASRGNDPWSVRWTSADMILVHYYTGVGIRDANKSLTVPVYRWNPLQLYWDGTGGSAPRVERGSPYTVTLQVQNTGALDWQCNDPTLIYGLGYHWHRDGYGDVAGRGSAEACGITKGDPTKLLSISIGDPPAWGEGTYTLRFDMFVASDKSTFWFASLGWPSYDIQLEVAGGETHHVYSPLVVSGDE